jgi:hypothetical protein
VGGRQRGNVTGQTNKRDCKEMWVHPCTVNVVGRVTCPDHLENYASGNVSS